MVELISLKELLEAAIGAEQTARKIYLGFTHKFATHPQASDFWQTLADDEGDHARILADLLSQVSDKEMASPVSAKLAEKADKLRAIDFHELVNSTHNLDEAYEVAYDLESSEVNTVFNFLTIRFLTTEESYDLISSTIDRHLLRLAEFSRIFGDAEHCKVIEAIV